MGHEPDRLSPVSVREQHHRLVVLMGEVEDELGPDPLLVTLDADPVHMAVGIQPSNFHDGGWFRLTEEELEPGPLARIPSDAVSGPPFRDSLRRGHCLVHTSERGRNNHTMSDIYHCDLPLDVCRSVGGTGIRST